MTVWIIRLGLRPALAGFALVLPMLSACADAENPVNARVPVSVHGVNHTADEFSFVISDPSDKKNRAGGETINSYGAGGTMCCFNLPKQWRPGLKAEVKATIWLPPTPTNNLPSEQKSYLLDIPVYEQGKTPELWILRTTDAEFILVASNLQPDHPEWPGKIKGWPVPSVEYQRMLHAREVKEAQSYLKLFENSLASLKKQPVEYGREIWEHRMIREAVQLKVYKGPDDPAFLAMLRAEYQLGLSEAQEQLKRLDAAKP